MALQTYLKHFNALVIGQSIQTLNNRLVAHYGAIKAIQRMKSFFLVGFVSHSIFRHVREDFIDIAMHMCNCMGLNLKSRFLESIKRESKEFKDIKKEPKAIIKQIPLISGINLKDYFLSNLASFSRQVAITQAEKLVFSFLECASICSIKSYGKRIPLVKDLLFLYPVAISKTILINSVFEHYTSKFDYLLAQLKDIAYFASRQINQLDAESNNSTTIH